MSDARYDIDFYAWTQKQATLLRALKDSDLDVENLAEEIEAAGRRSINQLSAALIRLLDNLIQIAAVNPLALGDKSTTTSAQIEVVSFKGQNVEHYVDLSKIWSLAGRSARDSLEEHGVEIHALPPECPLSLDQLLEDDFDPRKAVKIIVASIMSGTFQIEC